MQTIECLTDDVRQKFNIAIENETLYVTLYFYQTQKSWYFDIEYGDYICKGMRAVLTLNALRHLSNILPFGIGFVADGYGEPYAQDDFSSGRVQMVILSADEVQQLEQDYFS